MSDQSTEHLLALDGDVVQGDRELERSDVELARVTLRREYPRKRGPTSG